MMKVLKYVCFIIVLGVVACGGIKYQDDLGFLVSAQANSFEFPVYLNGKLCKDMEEVPGLCSKRIKSTDTIVVKFDPQQYAYTVDFQCSRDTGINFRQDVEKGKAFEYAIVPSVFQTLRSFTCIGEIFPHDRDQSVSAKWEVRIVVVDSKYVDREVMYIEKKSGKYYLVLGEHARSSTVWEFNSETNKWDKKEYWETTTVRIKDPKKTMACSESFNMRYNYYGF